MSNGLPYGGPMDAEPRPALSTAPPQRLRRLPSWLLNQLALRSTRLIGETLARPGVRADFAVLATLAEFGPSSQVEIGGRLGLDRSDVAAVLDRLDDAGHVAREPDARDRRRNVVTVTPAGAAALDALERELDAVQDTVLDPLTPDEREQLTALLQRLVDHHAAGRGPSA
jgi:MarR family transcriptional regulator, lower aerobic nicotinate degradation pathway regulator